LRANNQVLILAFLHHPDLLPSRKTEGERGRWGEGEKNEKKRGSG